MSLLRFGLADLHLQAQLLDDGFDQVDGLRPVTKSIMVSRELKQIKKIPVHPSIRNGTAVLRI